jgi:hypothetical protein
MAQRALNRCPSSTDIFCSMSSLCRLTSSGGLPATPDDGRGRSSGGDKILRVPGSQHSALWLRTSALEGRQGVGDARPRQQQSNGAGDRHSEAPPVLRNCRIGGKIALILGLNHPKNGRSCIDKCRFCDEPPRSLVFLLRAGSRLGAGTGAGA